MNQKDKSKLQIEIRKKLAKLADYLDEPIRPYVSQTHIWSKELASCSHKLDRIRRKLDTKDNYEMSFFTLKVVEWLDIKARELYCSSLLLWEDDKHKKAKKVVRDIYKDLDKFDKLWK